jgi:hypothetical protein
MIVAKKRQKRSTKRLVGKDVSFVREAEYIARRAADRDARVVTLGPLLFFSTSSGDAWVLDPGDSLARCLARDGEALPPGISETAETFSVEWTSDYRLDGEVFVFGECSGGVRAVMGYPVAEIRRAVRQMGMAR